MTSIEDKEGFEPIHEAHAIERVAFVVQFDSQFDDTVFDNLKEIAESFKDSLPGKSEIQSASLILNAKGSTAQSGKSGGIIRRKVSPDGSLESELRIERSTLTYLTTLYKGWNSVWNQVCEYFAKLLPHYLSNSQITSVGLNYVDKFAWNGHPNHCDSKLLLKHNSKYLCPHIFETNELWHSHTGVFINFDKDAKRLLNVDVNHFDEQRPEGQKRIISIVTTLTDHLNQSDVQSNSGNDVMIMVENHMNDMHNFGKTVLDQLLTDQMSKRIDLI